MSNDKTRLISQAGLSMEASRGGKTSVPIYNHPHREFADISGDCLCCLLAEIRDDVRHAIVLLDIWRALNTRRGAVTS